MPGPWEKYQQQPEPQGPASIPGLLQAGNIDLNARPVVHNADGTISTVRSMSANFDGREVLLPTVSNDGRILSNAEAIDLYRRTGRNLGIFDTPEHATAYAQQLHNVQAAQYAPAEDAPKPWERYAKNRIDSVTEPTTNPTEGMSTYEKMAAGAGKSVNDTFNGLRQLGSMAVQSGASSLVDSLRSTGLDGAADAVGRKVLVPSAQYGRGVQADIDESKALDAPLMHTKAGIAGNILGNVAQLAAGGAALRGTSLAAAALPRTVAGNSLQGLVLGGIQPVATGDSRTQNALLGAAGGAGGAVLAKGAGATFNALRSLIRSSGVSGTDRAAASIIMREASDPQGLMRGTPSAVPGVARSLGEETMDQGVMGLEQALRGPNRALFAPRDLANNAARVDAIRQFAGDDASMAAAASARDAASSSARVQAMAAGPVKIDNTMQALGDAIKEQQGRPAVQGALTQLRGLLVDAKGQPETRIQVLENVRQTIGDMLAGRYGGESAAALKGSRELIAVRDALNDEIGQQVPAFKQYLNAYRQGSVPINRMEVGQYLLSPKSGSAVTDIAGNQQLTPARFSAMARDLDSTVAAATGFPKAKATNILQPGDIKTITDIADDLAREFNRMKTTAGNSATSERGAVLSRIGNAGYNGMLNAIPGGRAIGTVLEGLRNQGDEAIQKKLAYLVANPAEARAVLSQLQPKQRAAVTRALIEVGSRGVPAAAASIGAAAASDQPLEIDIRGGRPVPAAGFDPYH